MSTRGVPRFGWGARGERPRSPRTTLSLFEVLQREVPVGEALQEDLDVLGAGVSVVDVIGVLPDVDGEQRLLPVLEREVGVAGLGHGELLVLAEHEPRPSGA